MGTSFRTIVGGRSDGYDASRDFPRGIEVLLKKARVDPSFRELLLDDPIAAADSIELVLSDSERSILVNTTRAVLKVMIGNTFVPRHHRNSFLTQKAPALLILVMASAAALPVWGAAGISPDDPRFMTRAAEGMELIQSALEAYKIENGKYPATDHWLRSEHPLQKYVEPSRLIDPWGRKFHYEGVTDGSGEVVNYRLESLGPRTEDPRDNIPCPKGGDLHRFPKGKAK